MLLMLRPHCFCRKGITVQCRAWEMLPLNLKGICTGRLHSRTYMSKEGCLRRNICQQNNHKNKTIGITLNSIVSNHKWAFNVTSYLRIYSNFPFQLPTSNFMHSQTFGTSVWLSWCHHFPHEESKRFYFLFIKPVNAPASMLILSSSHLLQMKYLIPLTFSDLMLSFIPCLIIFSLSSRIFPVNIKSCQYAFIFKIHF